MDTGASRSELIPKVLSLVPIEAGEVTSITTSLGSVEMGAGLAKLRLLGRVVGSSVDGDTTTEELPAELEGLEVVNPVTLGIGTKPLLGLNTLFTWGLSVDIVNRIFFNNTIILLGL